MKKYIHILIFIFLGFLCYSCTQKEEKPQGKGGMVPAYGDKGNIAPAYGEQRPTLSGRVYDDYDNDKGLEPPPPVIVETKNCNSACTGCSSGCTAASGETFNTGTDGYYLGSHDKCKCILTVENESKYAVFTKEIEITTSMTENIPMCPKVLNVNTGTSYSSIQLAYNAAGNNETIRSLAEDITPSETDVIYTENLSFNLGITVTMQGGYNCDYSAVIGQTIVKGSGILSDGKVTISNFTVKAAS